MGDTAKDRRQNKCLSDDQSGYDRLTMLISSWLLGAMAVISDWGTWWWVISYWENLSDELISDWLFVGSNGDKHLVVDQCLQAIGYLERWSETIGC